MQTTKGYLHLAGVVFRDDANAIEVRLLGDRNGVESSTHLSESQPTEDDPASLNSAVESRAD
jgi:hypothetical protein